MSKNYYWNDPVHNFAKVHEFGADITEFLIDSEKDENGKKVNDPRLKKWLESGMVSTEKPSAKEPRMGEVDSLKAQVATLKEASKVSEFDENQVRALQEKIKKLEEGGGGITQDELDKAKAESVQTDLDKIASLEKSAAGTAAETLELVKGEIANIQQGDSKAEIWDAVKEIKSWFKDN